METNIDIKKRKRNTLFLIAFLAFLVGVLIFLFFLESKNKKEERKTEPQPSPFGKLTSPTPTISPKEKVISLLPVKTEGYTIEYFPGSKKFFVLILKNPFEKYKKEAEEWFRSQGINPNDKDIFWSSVRGVIPKSP